MIFALLPWFSSQSTLIWWHLLIYMIYRLIFKDTSLWDLFAESFSNSHRCKRVLPSLDTDLITSLKGQPLNKSHPLDRLDDCGPGATSWATSQLHTGVGLMQKKHPESERESENEQMIDDYLQCYRKWMEIVINNHYIIISYHIHLFPVAL